MFTGCVAGSVECVRRSDLFFGGTLHWAVMLGGSGVLRHQCRGTSAVTVLAPFILGKVRSLSRHWKLKSNEASTSARMCPLGVWSTRSGCVRHDDVGMLAVVGWVGTSTVVPALSRC